MIDEFEEISFEIVGSNSVGSNDDSLQRTEEWFEARKGRFTGSRFKDLMGCGRSTSKQPWGSLEKLVDFGASAEKYIYQVGMERRTGQRSQEGSSRQMEWGKENEPKLIEQLVKDGVISDFVELGFEEFPDYENGGASVDGICIHKGEKVGLELKCCVSWDGHYARMYEKVHEKHNDFWQFQAEMLATGVKKILYVVTLPMTVEKYDAQIIHASEIHQRELLKRCQIADRAIELWDTAEDKKTALQIACASYKEKNEN